MKTTHILLALAALTAGVAVSQFTRSADPVEAARDSLPQLTDLSGSPTSLGQWRGKVVLVNFWATWCAPCREEIPLLIRMHSDYRADGLEVVGIAVDEPDPVRAYAAEMGIEYPLMLLSAEKAPAWLEHFGNDIGALPFSVVLRASGEVDSTKMGAYTTAELQHAVGQALSK